jgi:DNA-binding transcriptional LysR family regulator
MRLLPAGEAFLHHARRILAEVDEAVHAVRDVSRKVSEEGGLVESSDYGSHSTQ